MGLFESHSEGQTGSHEASDVGNSVGGHDLWRSFILDCCCDCIALKGDTLKFIDVFEGMTPELRTYLELPQCPLYKYEEGNFRKKTQASIQARQEWDEAVDKARGAIPTVLLQKYYQARLVWVCQDEHMECATETRVGPYTVDVCVHIADGCSFRRAVIHKDGIRVATAYREHYTFYFTIIENHETSGGHDLFVYADHRYGLAVIDLTTGEKSTYRPPNPGFIPRQFFPNPGGSILAVVGCMWGGADHVRFYDFTHPIDGRAILIDVVEDFNFDGWVSEGIAWTGWKSERVNLPGHSLHGIDSDELDSDCFDSLPDGNEIWQEYWKHKHTWVYQPMLSFLLRFVDRYKDRAQEGAPRLCMNLIEELRLLALCTGESGYDIPVEAQATLDRLYGLHGLVKGSEDNPLKRCGVVFISDADPLVGRLRDAHGTIVYTCSIGDAP